jgi:hypothetical protein
MKNTTSPKKPAILKGYYCLLLVGQIPICGFSTKREALQYRADHSRVAKFGLYWFDGREYLSVPEGEVA